jgi:hypothetical protein
MSDDLHDLLTQAAPAPARPLDVHGLVGVARRRRLRTRATVALGAAVAVVGAVIGLVALSSGGSTSIAVRVAAPTTTTSSIPAGWTRVTVDQAGISLAIPPDWRLVSGKSPSPVIVAGTAPFQVSDLGSGCLLAAASGVALYEFPPGATSVDIGSPGRLTVVPRPDDFTTVAPEELGCGTSGAPTTFTEVMSVAFTDAGRLFGARAATAGQAQNSLELAERVLNTLRVEPSTAATTTTGPDTSTTSGGSAPLTSTATVPPSTPVATGSNGGGFVNAGASADQQQVAQAFLGWLDGKTVDQAAPYVDDFASISDAEAQGFAQQAQNVAGYSGRVESVVIANPTHADVVYTLLHDGETVYANLPGKAVKVDGTWKVARDTACALLGMGGITCPARTAGALITRVST